MAKIVTGQKGPSHVLGGLSWWRSTFFGLLRGSESLSLPLRRMAIGQSLGYWRARGSSWMTIGVTEAARLLLVIEKMR
ncbi:hypothetical protein TorRG33x02_178380 [Trema orientale]|uniref:Uncharacterized protein n=1 Tax=Trema orientale TaxID=63057 RepID=A0A2P5ELE8_TREOI|nr:hypothetical protein TorRG33x02_178380 [Trema orientale]